MARVSDRKVYGARDASAQRAEQRESDRLRLENEKEEMVVVCGAWLVRVLWAWRVRQSQWWSDRQFSQK